MARIVTSKPLRWIDYVARMKATRNVCRISMDTILRNQTLGLLKRKFKENIRVR
jgi:hypothetical protein